MRPRGRRHAGASPQREIYFANGFIFRLVMQNPAGGRKSPHLSWVPGTRLLSGGNRHCTLHRSNADCRISWLKYWIDRD
jgi:hypothetical protein